ncbi:MAG: polysaccharide biosynthesis tyrosine autokinase [Bacteroidota bacterium]
MNTELKNISQENIHQQEDTIDIKKFVFKIIANWYWFIVTITISLLITYYINRYSDPIYKVSASILIKDKESSLSGGVETIISDLGLYSRARRKNVENEIGILKSYSIANMAIKALDFKISYFGIGRIRTPERYQNAPFKVELDTTKINSVNYPVYVQVVSKDEYSLEINGGNNVKKNIRFEDWYNSENFNFKISLVDEFVDEDVFSTRYYFIINDLNKLTNQYRTKLNIETTDKKSSVLLLSTQGYVAQKEVDYLNTLCDAYIQSDLDERNSIAINTIKFIDEQLMQITDSLTNVEDRLLNFRQANKTVDISREGANLFEKLEKLQTEWATIKIQLEYYDYILGYLKKDINYTDVLAPSVMGINDPLLNSLVKQLNELYTEKGVTEYSSTEKNPSINLINIKIENTRQALLQNVENIIDGTKISLNSVESRIKKSEAEIRKLPVTEKELVNIERKFELNDNIYTYLLEKRAEAGISKASNIPDNKVLDYALIENASQVAPKKSLNYTIALIIAILIPLIIIIIRDFFNDKIIERKDVEDHTSVPIIGTIGHNDKGTELVVHEKPKSAIAESFRTIRTNLQYMTAGKEVGCKVINISSTVSGEGKTFCAVNLASILAMSEKKTLIMGVDLRKPKLHKEFGVTNNKGLTTYLIGKDKLEDIIVNTDIENLDFIPAGPVPPNPAEMIDTKKMADLMGELQKIYDYIVLDTPPVALVTDALLLNKFTSINIFVVRQNYSSKSVLKFVNDLFAEKDMKSLSILINDVKVPSYYGYRSGYGYRYGGYGYSYGYGYGSGYGYGYYDDDEQIEKNSRFVSRILYLLRLKK